MDSKGPVKYALYDYSLYTQLKTKGWSKRARKNRTLVRKNTSKPRPEEKIVRWRVISKLHRGIIHSLKSSVTFEKFSMINDKPVKGSVKVLTA
jgi:hypothetical protein